MKKTHQWMLFFLFLFFVSEILACTKKEEKLVFYQTTQIQKMDDSKEDTQFFQEEAQTSQVSESSLHETTQAAVETIAVNWTKPVDTHRLVCFVTSVLNTP